MLVTFRTNSYADIVMFGETAETLLKMLGQSGNVPGAIMAEDVPPSLAALRAALTLEASSADTHKQLNNESSAVTAEQDDDDKANKVALGTRAVPLIELLEAAIKSNDNVQWDT